MQAPAAAQGAAITAHAKVADVKASEHLGARTYICIYRCKNIAARFHMRVPLLPSEEHHSHKIHSPYCTENGGTVNCTDAPLLELEEDAARDELGPNPNPNPNPSPNPNPNPNHNPNPNPNPKLGAELVKGLGSCWG